MSSCAVKDMGGTCLIKQKLNIKIDKDVENRVGVIKELAMVRDGLMSVYGDRFSCADVRVLIDFICN